MTDIFALQDRHTVYRFFHGYSSERKLEMFLEILGNAEEHYMVFDELNPRQKLQLLLNIQTVYSCFKTEAGLVRATNDRKLKKAYIKGLDRFNLLTSMAYQTPLADLKFEAERFVTDQEICDAALAKDVLEYLYLQMKFIIDDQDDEAIAVGILQQKMQTTVFENVFRRLAAIQIKRNNRDKNIKKILKNKFAGNFDVTKDVDMLDHDLQVHYYNSFKLDYEDNETDDFSYNGTFKFQCGNIQVQLEDILKARKEATASGQRKRRKDTANPIMDRIDTIREVHSKSARQVLKTVRTNSNELTSLDLLDNFSKVRGGI